MTRMFAPAISARMVNASIWKSPVSITTFAQRITVTHPPGVTLRLMDVTMQTPAPLMTVIVQPGAFTQLGIATIMMIAQPMPAMPLRVARILPYQIAMTFVQE